MSPENPVIAGPLPADATIHQRMVRIVADLPAIGRDQKNQQQGFMFRGYDDVLNALNPLLGEHGVYFVPDVLERVTGDRTTKSGSTMYEVNLHVEFTFYGLAGDSVKASGWGEGTDSGDKATNKAMTGALKYVLFQTFAIATAEATDSDQTTQEATTRADRRVEQAKTPLPTSWPKIEAAVRTCDNPEEAWALWEAFLRAATYHLYGQTSLKDIETAQRGVMLQKAAGAAVWIVENAKPEGPFTFYDEALMRLAWGGVLDGHELAIPDYVAPEKAHEELDEAAAEAASAE